ncbi:MAG TPA: OmpA family protein [Pyrinomonadaceae bacterium]|nr:OmpA family protein [Pyrinomonadaceae bacterium]
MTFNASRVRLLALALLLAAAPAAVAQTTGTSASANTRTVASGQKMKVKGIVTRRDFDQNTIVIRDANGVDTVVQLADTTRVRQKGGFFGGGKNYAITNILRGLRVEVEGRGDTTGNLAATKVEFSESDLRVAQSLEARVDPVESRVGTAEGRIEQVEQNAQRMSGQLDELAAISNAARGGAKAAQDTADAAVAGVRATNDRISALDDYEAQQSVAVNFRVNSAVLSSEARTQLDEIARQALAAKGYVIEVSGHASSDGATDHNRRLSQRRADAVVRYLAENHRIPLRRIITPFGYGESQQVAENTTRAGRAENRRVEVKVLVNRGLLQAAPQMATPASDNPTN